MAIAYKPTKAAMITPGKKRAFIEQLNSNSCTKEYWNECAKSKRISSDAMKHLKEKK